MKKIMMIMFSFLLIVATGYGQSKKELRKREKQAKKEAKALEEAKNIELAKKMLDSKQFVLEATFLSDKQGQRVSVTPNINFIVVDDEKVAFQFAGGNRVGYNGLGGVTVDGHLRNFKYSVNKKGVYYVDFQIVSSMGTNFIHMTVMGPTLRAEASLRGNTSNQLNFSGTLVPLDQSMIFKGMSF